ncbi:RNA-binding domain-containing protein [Dendrothele bispora CBS 962.96]|uniref:RNA-binding domain-containing protein n=1 Tax=Dendrothele bispora (strain CBS 962.96) TaxID=1314807 RepID=A0A4S8MKT2_DENBC|nr:RNA-binding domain-containing protein [Dendrothele bispora CBS 962.96]
MTEEAAATATTTQPTATIGAESILDDPEEAETQEILLMKQRVAEMEAEAEKLRQLQAAAEAGDSTAGSAPPESEDDKAAADGRSVYVGNVDYSATPEDIQAHFQACGTINRVTILCDKFTGHPKGYAYVEFAEPEHIDAALTMDNSLFHGRLIKACFFFYVLFDAKKTLLMLLPNLSKWTAGTARTMSTASSKTSSPKPYPFSKTALVLPEARSPPPKPLLQGKGLMPHLLKTLPPQQKQTMLRNLFSRKSPNCILPGSIVNATLEHAPFQFTGVVLGVRRRGPDTSLVLRNVVQRMGVEMQIYPCSPHVKELKVVRQPPRGRMRRAKLFYLRDSPEKMSAIAGGSRK